MKKISLALIITVSSLSGFCQASLSAAEKEGTDLYKEQKPAEAIVVFKKALIENPKSLYSLNALSSLYFMTNDFTDAYDIADKGLKLSGGAANFVAAKAKAAISSDRAQEAITIIDQYHPKEPDYMMLFIKGSAYNAVGDLQQAITMLSESITANPNYPDAYLERGKSFGGIDRYPQALKDYNKYISMVDDNSEAFNYRGLIYYNAGKPGEAIADYSKAIAAAPKNKYAFNNRGVVYREAGKIDQATADFNAAISIDAGFADPYLEFALLYDGTKDYANALAMINKAVAIDPSRSVFFGEQSKLLLTMDHAAEGLAAAQKAVVLDPKNPDGYLWETSAYYNLNKFDDALKAADAGIAVLPEYYLLYTLRAEVHRAKNETALADADDQKAKELSTK